MKNSRKILILPILALALSTSCKKEEKVEPETTITSDDMADLLAASIGTSTYGYNSSAEEAAQRTSDATSQSTPCLYALDTTIVKTFTGPLVTYNYNLNYKYQMYCTNSIPQNIVCNMTSSGNLEQTKITANSSASGVLTISGLAPATTNYSAVGSYSREGSATSKVRSKNSFSYHLTLNLSDLNISKSTFKIGGGAGTITMDATTSTGKVFNFTGSITYVNETTATLVINGTSYTLNIPTSEIN